MGSPHVNNIWNDSFTPKSGTRSVRNDKQGGDCVESHFIIGKITLRSVFTSVIKTSHKVAELIHCSFARSHGAIRQTLTSCRYVRKVRIPLEILLKFREGRSHQAALKMLNRYSIYTFKRNILYLNISYWDTDQMHVL